MPTSVAELDITRKHLIGSKDFQVNFLGGWLRNGIELESGLASDLAVSLESDLASDLESGLTLDLIRHG